MDLDITVEGSDVESASLHRSVASICASTRLLALATSGADGNPWINNAYFAFDKRLSLYFLTPPSAHHSANLSANPRAAVSIADSQQTGDDGKRGIQLGGRCQLVSEAGLEHALSCYRDRFPSARDALASMDSMIQAGMESRMYEFLPSKIRVFDEAVFGEEVWVDGLIS